MEIVLVRHGESVGNLLLNEEDTYIGQTDYDLTEDGYEQARKIAGESVFNGVEAFYSSDLKRCVETTRILTDQKPILDRRLRERSLGEFEGKKRSEVLKNPEYRKYFSDPELMDFRHSFTAKAPDGENYTDVCDRVSLFLADLAKTEFKKVAIVSHGVPLVCFRKVMDRSSKRDMFSLWSNGIEKCKPVVVKWDKNIHWDPIKHKER